MLKGASLIPQGCWLCSLSLAFFWTRPLRPAHPLSSYPIFRLNLFPMWLLTSIWPPQFCLHFLTKPIAYLTCGIFYPHEPPFSSHRLLISWNCITDVMEINKQTKVLPIVENCNFLEKFHHQRIRLLFFLFQIKMGFWDNRFIINA